METTIRRRTRATAFRVMGWLTVASMVGIALAGPSAGIASADNGNAGSIWTTSVTCATPALQDQNQYSVGDHVYIRGDGFAVTTTYYFQIVEVNAGGGSKPVVASGSTVTDALTGYFCVDAHTIAATEAGGEYDVQVDTNTDFHGAKHDNYKVNTPSNPLPAHLTLVKNVDNELGGTATAGDWTLSATGPATLSGAGGASGDVPAGTYALSESIGPENYVPGSWSCDGGSQDGSSVALAAGDSATCTITNAFTNNPPPRFGSLVVTKTLAGNLTGFAGGDFKFSVDCGEESSHAVTINLATGSQSAPAINDIPADASCTVTETSKADAETYGSWDSPAAGHATIVAGQTVTVTITNTRTYSPPSTPTCEQLGNCPVVRTPTPEGTPTPTPVASGAVLSATATPRITPPPTSTLPITGTPGGDTWRIALLAIAGLVATLLLLAPATPAKARRRR